MSSIDGNEMLEVQINSITTKLLVDSGCQKNLPEAIYQHIKDTTKLVKTD